MRIQELGRIRLETALYTGWFAERFAREERLQGPTGYIDQMLNGKTDPDLAEAMAEAELTRMAIEWGLELQDLSDEAEGG